MKWIIASIAGALFLGCAAGPGSSTQPAASRGKAQMWADNCVRCHNARSPAYYSDEQWNVAMHHMWVRCYLTAEEARAVTDFLKSAN